MSWLGQRKLAPEGRTPTWPGPHEARSGLGTRLRWRIGGVLLLVSLVPIALLGVGSWLVFSRVLMGQALQLQRTSVAAHASAVDLYLAERLRALELAARTHRYEQLADQSHLQDLFDSFVQSYPNAFVDLGVIDARGNHVAYVGPYRLENKNYATAEWFETALSRGTFISDVFLGYRNVPHSIIAVKRHEEGRVWILRATINNDSLSALVRAGAPQGGGDAFLLDRQGRYQTPPRVGEVLDASGLRLPPTHRGVTDSRIQVEDTRMVQAAAWLNQGQWLLVVQQPAAAIMKPIHEAALTASIVLVLVIGAVGTVTLLATRHLTDQVDRANLQRDRLREDLIRSARLASLGEIASGLAHEINNPLGVISAEQTNLEDLLSEEELGAECRITVQGSLARCKRQVERCAGITAKMLQFARESSTHVQPTHLAPLLRNLHELLDRQARVNNIELRHETEPDLPAALADGSELEQVVVNLVNNAIHAIGQDGVITVRAQRAEQEVELSVEDDGCGVEPEDLDRMFRPFFTTKPPGKGTGLGLPVCHGFVTGWGGRIEVESQVGRGTTLRVFLRTEPSRGAASPVEDPGCRVG